MDIAVVFLIFYMLPISTIDGPLVHIIGLVICVLILGVCFFLLSHKHTLYISHVNPTSEKEVLDWYATQTGVDSPPLATAADSAFAEWYNKLHGGNCNSTYLVFN